MKFNLDTVTLKRISPAPLRASTRLSLRPFRTPPEQLPGSGKWLQFAEKCIKHGTDSDSYAKKSNMNGNPLQNMQQSLQSPTASPLIPVDGTWSESARVKTAASNENAKSNCKKLPKEQWQRLAPKFNQAPGRTLFFSVQLHAPFVVLVVAILRSFSGRFCCSTRSRSARSCCCWSLPSASQVSFWSLLPPRPFP